MGVQGALGVTPTSRETLSWGEPQSTVSSCIYTVVSAPICLSLIFQERGFQELSLLLP